MQSPRLRSLLSRCGLALLAVLAAAPTLRFGPFGIVPIQTDKDQVNFLIAIHRTIPQTLNSSVFYNRNILELLQSQRKVRNQIEAMPELHALEEHRPHPFKLTLTAHPRVDNEEIVMIMDPAAIRSWRSSLGDTAYDIRDTSRDTVQNLHEKVKAAMNGNHVEPQKMEKLAQVAVYMDRYLQTHNPQSDGMNFRMALRDSEEGDINYLEEDVLTKKILARYSPSKASMYEAALKRAVDKLKSQKIPATSRFEGSVVVADVAPDVGIFRGFYGNDCSTMLSFPYPYSPLERTFFLYDENGKRLGYGAGTHVMFNGKPAFYFHTINGPWINAAQVQQVIDGLYRARKELGVEKLVLSTEHRARDNINFDPVESTFVSNIRKSKDRPGAIEHLDSPLRAVFHDNSRGHYDLEKNNNEGFEYIPDHDPTAIADLKVEMNPSDIIQPMNEGEVAPLADVLLLAQGLMQVSGREDVARWALKTYGYGEKEWADYLNFFDSVRELAPAERDAKLRAKLGEWGLTAQQFDLHHDYFENGPKKLSFIEPKSDCGPDLSWRSESWKFYDDFY